MTDLYSKVKAREEIFCFNLNVIKMFKTGDKSKKLKLKLVLSLLINLW